MTLARTRRRTEDCETVGGSGDADELETDPSSSRSTLQAELESGGYASLSASSSSLPLGLVGSRWVCAYQRLKIAVDRSRHVGGLVEHEIQARVVRMLWVLRDGTLILDDAAHDLLHLLQDCSRPLDRG